MAKYRKKPIVINAQDDKNEGFQRKNLGAKPGKESHTLDVVYGGGINSDIQSIPDHEHTYSDKSS